MLIRMVRQSVKYLMKTCLPRHFFMVDMPASSRTIYLTFDDGPDPVETTRVLDALKKNNIKATFFLIGEKIQKNPELVKRILEEGHVIGHHTYFHKQPHQVNARELKEEIEKTEKLMMDISGKPASLFRPPLGKLTLGKMMVLWKKGKSVCLWNNDPRDYSCSDLDQVLDHFKDQPVQAGDVILMHDNHPYAADAISYLNESATQSNLKFETLSSLKV